MVELTPEIAALALDLFDIVNGPMSAASVVLIVQQSCVLIPAFEEAMRRAGIDPDDNDIERPDLPDLISRPKAKS